MIFIYKWLFSSIFIFGVVLSLKVFFEGANADMDYKFIIFNILFSVITSFIYLFTAKYIERFKD